MQLAARAFGEQREVVGIQAKIQVERALRADLAIDGQAGGAGAEAQLVEGPVFAMQPTRPLPVAVLPRKLPVRLLNAKSSLPSAQTVRRSHSC